MLAGREITYDLVRKKVKNVNLRIRADCSVYVSANEFISIEAIEKFLLAKADYIIAALDKYSEIAKYSNLKHNYVTGESFRYLGRDLRLVVLQGDNSLYSDGIYLSLNVADTNDIALKSKLVEKWFDEQCRKIVGEIVDEVFCVFRKYGVDKPKVSLKNMTSRWGSCQPKRGSITLNKQLIEVPKSAIKYVVVHEFVHFLHPNHSKNFYEMLTTIMPDWKEQKKLLEDSAFYTAR
jgi:predicted metal-dependent hydrolase